MTTSSLRNVFPGTLVGFMNFPEDFTISLPIDESIDPED
jgi:hypothetical protein